METPSISSESQASRAMALLRRRQHFRRMEVEGYRRTVERRVAANSAVSKLPDLTGLSWQEYLLGLLLFVFLTTGAIYTYLFHLLHATRPTPALMAAISRQPVALPADAPPNVVGEGGEPPPISPKEARRREQLKEDLYREASEVITPSRQRRPLDQLPECPVGAVLSINQTLVCESQRPPPLEGSSSSGVRGQRLLTLMTATFDVAMDQVPHATKNLLELWPRLGARVRPLLFIFGPDDDMDAVKRACNLGWDVLVAPSCGADGAPLIAAMWDAAQKLEKRSLFYGYAHRKTLFDWSLLETLRYLEGEIDSFPENLIVGQRTNLKLLRFDPAIPSIANLARQAKARGTLGWLLNVDYFLSTRDSFQPSADAVSGARNLGNWMVWEALRRRTVVIDISNTTTAVHQMLWTVPRHVPLEEPQFPAGFDPTSGMVWCAPLKVRYQQPEPEKGVRRVPVRKDYHDMILLKRTRYGLCGPGQWSRLPINHRDVPQDDEAEFLAGMGIMFPREINN